MAKIKIEIKHLIKAGLLDKLMFSRLQKLSALERRFLQAYMEDNLDPANAEYIDHLLSVEVTIKIEPAVAIEVIKRCLVPILTGEN